MQADGRRMIDDDPSYERFVTGLEIKYADSIAYWAKAGVRNCRDDESYDFKHESSRDAVEGHLFASPEWSDVDATDISDIAYEAATRATDELHGLEAE